MKRKLYFVGLAVLALLGIYSLAAGRMLRGAGAYRMGTTLGTVLAQSRPYTALAAWVLLAVLAVITVIWGRKAYAAGTLRLPKRKKREEKPAAPVGGTAPMPAGAGKIPAAGATAPMPAGEGQIPPAAPTEPMEEKIPAGAGEAPAAEATVPMPAEGEGQIPPAAPAEPMEEETSAGAGEASAAEATVRMPAEGEGQIPPAAPAEPMEEEIPAGAGEAPAAAAPVPAAEQTPPAAGQPDPAPEVRFCMHCGAKLWAGQKFCSKCGTPVEGVKG